MGDQNENRDTSPLEPATRNLPYPFMRVVGRAGEPTNWMAIWAPMLKPEWQQRYERFAERYRFVAFTSFLDFPYLLESDDNPKCIGLAEAWGHCFRNPEAYFPAGVRQAFLPQSEFTSSTDVHWDRLPAVDVDAPAYDLVYVCLEHWRTQESRRDVKGFSRALKCIRTLHEELGLRTLIVGPNPSSMTEPLPPGTAVVEQLKWFDLLAQIRRSKMLLVASSLDASPRVITEAMCLDRPVLMYRRILGGWHYVNPTTGAFFDDNSDVVDAAKHCLTIETGPRAYYKTHHGPVVAGLRLKKLLAPLDPSIAQHNLLRLTFDAGPEDEAE